jgi:catechol 2,3-dioxygenase-like lactoylglutathione lyase family enzyme
MNLLGIEKMVFGVADPDLCKRFWRDFGLDEIAGDSEHGLFECATKARVEIRKLDDPALPPPVVKGSTVREIVYAADSQATVDGIGEELAKDREVRKDIDGSVHSRDPEGYGIGFAVSHRIKLAPADTKYNAPWQADRFDQPAKFYKQAVPQHLAHVVFYMSDPEGTPAFYRERLGFKLTDAYVQRGCFLRCGGAEDHHNLFLMHVPGTLGFHHCCFELRDFHEVFGGGLAMHEKGWDTHIGPGRHNVTSAYYWYFRNPGGGAAEYGFDTDRVTDAWQPRLIEPTPGAFAEWSLEDGMGRFEGLQHGVETADNPA